MSGNLDLWSSVEQTPPAQTKAITAERLKELLEYNPISGLFAWRKRSGRGSHAVIGSVAGNTNSKGYVQIKIDGTLYKAHRLAWRCMTGEWPVSNIDHINMVKDDNAWLNLREANNSQNGANRRAYNCNTTGMKGVTRRGNGLYRAQIKKNGVVKYLGDYATPEDAGAAYQKAALLVHGEFARAS